MKNKLVRLLFLGIVPLMFVACYSEDDKKEVVKIRETLEQIQKELKESKIIRRTVPSQETLEYFVKVYKLSPEEEKPKVEFINQYEKDGRTYVIMQVNKKICDMPLLYTSSGWTANGVSCK